MIVRSLYGTFARQLPWEWFFDRDMRTILNLHPAAKDMGDFVDVKNYALHDARHEARQLAKSHTLLQSLIAKGTCAMAAYPHPSPRASGSSPSSDSSPASDRTVPGTKLLIALQWMRPLFGFFCLIGVPVVIAKTPDAWPM
ncbi:hypothetical protein CTTA_2890 [Comamonas testosteroni]|uniref:3'-5' exoribonuclease Rv2179c-like domain-containing protein n=1 Tax=Comamonas testosteroni TaxID=285 RepID=A0A5A7MGT8_COMTE|nr:hypothetical protein CTTA_2890 [Comamonas testosteroni]